MKESEQNLPPGRLRRLPEQWAMERRIWPKAKKRIKKIVNDPNLGLDGGDYDGLFSSTGFIQRLLEVMEIDDEESRKDVDEIREIIYDDQYGYQPWMFVDTGFKRKSEPIFVLAFSEGGRRIPIRKDIKRLPRDEQIKRLSEEIRSHQKSLEETDGKLCIWGRPEKYICHIGENDIVEMTTDGELISEIDHNVSHGRAVISLR